MCPLQRQNSQPRCTGCSRIFVVFLMTLRILCNPQTADVQAALSLHRAHMQFLRKCCDPAKCGSLASVRTTVSEVSMPNAWHLTSRLYYTRRYRRCRKSELFSSCVSVPMFSDTHAKCRCILCNSEDTNTTSIGFFKQLAGRLVSACMPITYK